MFYQIPELVYSPLAELHIVNGTVLVVNDDESKLKKQIIAQGCQVYSCSLEDLLDLNFFSSLPEIDWVVCVTQGLGKKTEWVTDTGMAIAQQGFCLLDRISFLEPTRSREVVLQTQELTHMIVLSPRPAFRADNKQAKDSVTSAWFVFSSNRTNQQSTKINFALNWQRPRALHSVK
tara:strand:+ start:246 stop:773 length:528 start_codon:yes stop_codon:yes gene_type:complete